MKSLFSEDVDFINKFYSIHAELGTTQKCCNNLEYLSKEHPEPWKSILLGLCHILKGDGLHQQTYNNREDYEKAYHILDEAQKRIKNKKRLLFLFTERNKLEALALSLTHPINDIKILFDEFIDNLKTYDAPAIQAEVAKAMLSRSFIIWKYSEIAKEQGLISQNEILFKKSVQEAELITSIYDSEKYKYNFNIQQTIAKTLFNRAIDFNRISKEYIKKSNDQLREIISKYSEYEDIGLQKQVAKAMFNIAQNLHREKIIADVEIKDTLIYPSNRISIRDVIMEYDRLKERYYESPISEIQQYVLLSIMGQITIYEEYDDIGAALNSYKELISYSEKYKESLYLQDNHIEFCKSRELTLQKQLESEEIEKSQYDEWEKLDKEMEELYEFYPCNKQHIETLTNLICDGQITPFVGAGLSHFMLENNQYAYPLWGEFVDGVYAKYRYLKVNDVVRQRFAYSKQEFESMNSIDKASFLQEQLGQALFSSEIVNTFKQIPYKSIKDIIKQQPYILFPELFKRFVLTTNFDNLIEQAYQEKEQCLSSCSVYDIDKLDDYDDNRTILYKLHGTIELPNSIILTRNEYNEHYTPNGNHCKILNKYLRGNRVLFMGCSLDDENILPFCTKKSNYALYPCLSTEIEEAELKLSNMNVIPILFPSGEYQYIYSILRRCVLKKNKYDTMYLIRLFTKAQSKLGEMGLKGFLEHIIYSNNYNSTSNTQGLQKYPIDKEISIPVFSDIKLKK